LKQAIKFLITPKQSVKSYGWFGDYKSWEAVEKKSTGYNELEILNKVDAGIQQVVNGDAAFERDSMAFKELEYSKALLDVFTDISKQTNKPPKYYRLWWIFRKHLFSISILIAENNYHMVGS
jgi:hypothetical protein